ncbi:SpoIID/LytB domain-containing protein [Acaryochloris sp. IP29b_bin.137]|uniref:SpoIID/LytB domain-containing protein n=1 Tax=Acaryochloris sp. IP29b_bin.137 TaxID=2969217 RepID=UPI00263223FC|nr:SpoIID/LytB domain-containing protein [Acaryochloris sp. IP29b_bin.137]
MAVSLIPINASATVNLPTANAKVLAQAVNTQPLNPRIKVGINQRFGRQSTDKLTIQALPGDQLTLQFTTGKALETLTTDKVEFAITPTPLKKPRWQERVVLSVHRSFETAETKANEFKALGIPVEIAQPKQWQVWAKRDQYPTAADRILLIDTLKQQGYKNVFLHRRRLHKKPQLSFVTNGYQYKRSIVSITSKKQQFQIGEELHYGSLRFQPNTYGTYTLVNKVPTETYLRGVVPYEIGFNAPTTAIEAQTIIARTYALRNLRRFKIDGYELCADTQCQVYKGIAKTDPIVDRAIKATTGQVLTHNNELVDALYSSTTGGVTAAFQEVWEGTPRPYLTAKIDALPQGIWDLNTRSLADESNLKAFINLKQGFNEASWRTFRWETETPMAKLNEFLRQFLRQTKHPLANFKTIQKLEIVERSHGGRVQKLQVTTDLGSLVLAKDDILRGFEAPNSLLFYVEPQYQTVQPKPSSPAEPAQSSPTASVQPAQSSSTAATDTKPRRVLKGYAFIGGGFGHGVGLSQTGSYHLSNQGWSATQILNFYYPGTQVEPLNDSIVFWQQPTILTVPSEVIPDELKPKIQPQSNRSNRLFSHKMPFLKSFQWIFDWLPFL